MYRLVTREQTFPISDPQQFTIPIKSDGMPPYRQVLRGDYYNVELFSIHCSKYEFLMVKRFNEVVHESIQNQFNLESLSDFCDRYMHDCWWIERSEDGQTWQRIRCWNGVEHRVGGH